MNDIKYFNVMFKEISINKEYYAIFEKNLLVNKYVAYILENTKEIPDIYEFVEKL